MKKILITLTFLPFAAIAQNKVGINTKTPAALLDVNGTLVVRSAPSITTSTKAKDSLVVFEDGAIKVTTAANVVAQSGAGSAIVGDIKTGIQTGDHSGWIKLDGRLKSSLTSTQQAAATGLGIGTNLPDATDAYLSQTGVAADLGKIKSSNTRTIAQNQLPNVNYTGSLTGIAHGSNATGTSGVFSKPSVSAMNLGPAGGASYVDNYDFSLFLNGNVTQQVLDIKPQTLVVNTFIYLGN